jgi:cystathionine beta-lyase family protein involved in aluminum resistance
MDLTTSTLQLVGLMSFMPRSRHKRESIIQEIRRNDAAKIITVFFCATTILKLADHNESLTCT